MIKGTCLAKGKAIKPENIKQKMAINTGEKIQRQSFAYLHTMEYSENNTPNLCMDNHGLLGRVLFLKATSVSILRT